MTRRGAAFWLVQLPGWMLFLYLVYAQAIPAFSYDLGVAMGTQEPVSRITGVGVAFWYGFAVGDLLIYIPLLVAGLIGHALTRTWGRALLAAAAGITIYWPTVCLVAIASARRASGWSLPNEALYWIVLPVIALWGILALWQSVHGAGHEATEAPHQAHWFGHGA